MLQLAVHISNKKPPADLGEAVSRMLGWLDRYAAGRALPIMALAALLVLAILSREDRRRLFWPLILGAVVIFCPFLYMLVYYRIIYWRFFWLLPDAVLIALCCVRLMSLIHRLSGRLVVFLIVCALVMFCGSYTYYHFSFTRITNPEGVSEGTQAVADFLLEREASPFCLVESSLYSEIRQYDGSIRLVYGRNAEGYIGSASAATRKIAAAMAEKKTKYKQVLRYAARRSCSYIVVDKSDPIPRKTCEGAGYKKIRTLCDYIIYYRDFAANPYIEE